MIPEGTNYRNAYYVVHKTIGVTEDTIREFNETCSKLGGLKL